MSTEQYIKLGKRIIEEGVPVYNKRTGTTCYTVINHDMVYDVGNNEFPLVTTRKSYYKSAIAELLGYIRGYDNAQQFADIGTKTWFANANENKDWLNSPYRKGENDLGRVYGVQGRKWTNQFGESIDQLKQIVDDLSNGIDNRGEILSFWNPSEFKYGALRPCMYEHQFSILDGTLYLNSTQRSCDVPLGLNFNSVQVYVFLLLMAKITGLKVGKAYHKIINAHVYENQMELFKEEMSRTPFESPELYITADIKTLEDLETWVSVDNFTVEGYNHHQPIKYPFTA